MDTPPATSRALRLAEIRRQIAQGTYETPEKLETAVCALLEELERTPRAARESKVPPHKQFPPR